MLVGLSIRNVVLIDRLDLAFEEGLSVLTGETGAGKSILLDALGLSLGMRAESGLVRQGSDQASVTASFEISEAHPVVPLLAEQDMPLEEDILVLRRTVNPEGRSRAYINDQPVSVSLLRSVGEVMVEIEGQFAQHGLMDAATHRGLLDSYGNLESQAQQVSELWRKWQDLRRELEQARESLEQARRDEEYLRHALEELEALDPQPGEDEKLGEQRQFMMNSGKLLEALNGAAAELEGDGGGAERALANAQRQLEKVADKADGRLNQVLAALERAAAELADAEAELSSVTADLDLEPERLEEVESRYFALKDMARKHGCQPDDLPDLRARFAEQLAGIDGGNERLAALDEQVRAAQKAYRDAAADLMERRTKSAKLLSEAVNCELPPLRLEKAQFVCQVTELAEESWGAQGMERIQFEVSTNPGAKPGALNKIASGGELARFLLALKVVLAQASPVECLIFDEVDSGVGGATADAIGERLARLAEARQLLVITHSPQVAARGRHHWRVTKDGDDSSVLTRVSRLDMESRREEVARMLSGAQVTQEARAAAQRLMGE
ncbi:DNA repair protein RecN [Fodinicurvata fenggangensis]|uniref:DNA repair protein RecN n=1 Tax=Fodinicurvata fenggangensis TaxID=1121830 RepID=UPI00047E0F3D|nr:DNA repair protein RecN [Fodinicurvata fenggangensis]